MLNTLANKYTGAGYNQKKTKKPTDAANRYVANGDATGDTTSSTLAKNIVLMIRKQYTPPITLVTTATNATEYICAEIADWNTMYFPKNPANGGTPAIENSNNAKEIPNTGLVRPIPANSLTLR